MIPKLLPSALREFLPYISPAAFNLVSKTELFSRLSQIARLCFNKEKTAEFKSRAHGFLPPQIEIAGEIETPLLELRGQEAALRKNVGDALLSLYFCQLYNPSGLFCDLRTGNFQLSYAPDSLRDAPASGALLKWAPPAYWFTFDPRFRTGLIELYDGYYLNDPARVDRAILQLRLVPEDATPHQLEMIRHVFQRHFGPGEQEAVSFSLAKFRASFQDIFDVLIQMKHRIPVDFSLLGIYLVGLYWALEQTEFDYDVRAIYLKTRAAHLK